jgi:hypothetical protein
MDAELYFLDALSLIFIGPYTLNNSIFEFDMEIVMTTIKTYVGAEHMSWLLFFRRRESPLTTYERDLESIEGVRPLGIRRGLDP